MKQSKANVSRSLARLARDRRLHGITLERVALEASKTSTRPGRTVGITTVSNVLAGRTKSKNIIDTLKRLVAEAKAGQLSGEQEQSVA